MASVLIGRGKDSQRHRKEGHVKTKADVEVTQLQAQEHGGIPGAIRS